MAMVGCLRSTLPLISKALTSDLISFRGSSLQRSLLCPTLTNPEFSRNFATSSSPKEQKIKWQQMDIEYTFWQMLHLCTSPKVAVSISHCWLLLFLFIPSHAIDAYSRTLITIPTTIADNAGLDSAELIAQLRSEHHKEESNAGIDVIAGTVRDMAALGIYEAFKVKQAVFLSATEAAEMILRVDEIITCAPRRREDRM